MNFQTILMPKVILAKKLYLDHSYFNYALVIYCLLMNPCWHNLSLSPNKNVSHPVVILCNGNLLNLLNLF